MSDTRRTSIHRAGWALRRRCSQ